MVANAAVAVPILAGILTHRAWAASPSPSPTASSTPIAATAGPQAMTTDPEYLRTRSLLEDQIATRFRQELGSQLEPGTFSVSARVKLEPAAAAPVAPRPGVSGSDSPGGGEDWAPPDLTLGEYVVQAEAQLAGADDRGNPTGAAAAASAGRPYASPWILSEAELNVGLSEKLPEAARTEIEQYVKRRMAEDFGNKGNTQVRILRKPDAGNGDDPKKTGTDGKDDLWRKLAEFQPLIGLALLGILVFLGIWLLGRSLAKASTSAGPKKKKGVTDDASVAAPPPASPSAVSPNPTVSAQTITNTIQTVNSGQPGSSDAGDMAAAAGVSEGLARRIRRVAQQLGPRLKTLTDEWFASGESGQRKFALFLESTADTREGIDLTPEQARELLPVFQKMADLPTRERLRTLHEVYWEVIAYKNLGISDLEKPLVYLDRVGEAMLKELIAAENPRLQGILALHMPDGARRAYLAGMDLDAKQRLLEETLGVDKFQPSEIDAVNASLREKVRSSTAPLSQQELAALPLVPGLLAAFNPIEETVVLGRLRQSAPERAAELRNLVVSPAFLPEWKDRELTYLLGLTPGDELVALLRLQPELKDRVLALAPPITGQIVSEELQTEDRSSDQDRATRLSNLRERMNRALADLGLSPAAVYGAPEAAASPEARAA